MRGTPRHNALRVVDDDDETVSLSNEFQPFKFGERMESSAVLEVLLIKSMRMLGSTACCIGPTPEGETLFFVTFKLPQSHISVDNIQLSSVNSKTQNESVISIAEMRQRLSSAHHSKS